MMIRLVLKYPLANANDLSAKADGNSSFFLL